MFVLSDSGHMIPADVRQESSGTCTNGSAGREGKALSGAPAALCPLNLHF